MFVTQKRERKWQKFKKYKNKNSDKLKKETQIKKIKR